MTGPGHRILLFVDQFEELYTLGAAPEERAAFVACLEGAADDASSPLRVLLAVRSDFLDRMAEERHFMTDVTGGLWFLPPMGRERPARSLDGADRGGRASLRDRGDGRAHAEHAREHAEPLAALAVHGREAVGGARSRAPAA